MPLLFSEPFAETGLLGVWETTETLEELLPNLANFPDELAEAEGLAHPQKRLEFAVSRTLARRLVESAGLVYQGLVKDEFGKPALRGHDAHLSLTHGPRHAAAVLHPTQAVGIDLEAPRDSLRRVAPRILSPTELAHADNDLYRLTVYWTAKEALYKLFGKRGLFFREQLWVQPFSAGDRTLMAGIRAADAPETCRISVRVVGGEVLAVATAS